MQTINTYNKQLLFLALSSLSVISSTAREMKDDGSFRKSSVHRVTAGCAVANSRMELAVNNVRTIIYSGSDMWWDLNKGSAYYYVPKVEDKSKGASSNFAGNVWFGGKDDGGQLKVAAQTYRQDGVDFWTGPLSTIDASISPDQCLKYDKIFKITRAEVDNFVLGGGPITTAIKEWPGNGDLSLNQDPYLAPWVDKFGVAGGDGVYEPEQGDYPYYDVYNNAGKDNLGVCKARVFGDETLWWVYNDKGDVHTATGGKAIGLEVRAQAFAFKTTDEINNATFYSYQIINRSSFRLNETYMTVWTDADLGYSQDDYIGCDVKRGLGFVYNGDSYDETTDVPGYLDYMPALGCDFFQGPINTANGIDDDKDGSIDEPGEQMGMSKFLYYNNNISVSNPNTQNPNNAVQTYQYMTGFWKDGTPFTCDVPSGYGGATPTSYMFPGDSYPASPCGATSWEETSTPNDRRFLQSAGPFILEAGAVNFVTVGLPWAKATAANSPKSALPLLKLADDKAQSLFDNCFKVLSGPEAPDMTIQEMDNELILYFTNKVTSNNYLNQYKELDVSIIVDTTTSVVSGSTTTTYYKNVDRYYHFEGYKVYQLRNDAVTQEDLTDLSKAKLVFSCDVNNGITRLVNYEYDASSGGDVAKVKAEGKDNGIASTFHFTKDEFSTSSDKKVVNNKQYYFLAVAYAYNQYGEYKEDTPWSGLNSACSLGQKLTYLEGRKSKKAYGIPHIPDPEKSGSITNSFYGYGPKITRVEGTGNGGNVLDFTQETMDAIVSNGSRVNTLTYENGRGPVNVKVVDPLNVPNSEFSISFIKKKYYSNEKQALDSACNYSMSSKVVNKFTNYGSILGDSVTWVLRDLTNNKDYKPCKSIKIGEEFYFSEIGLSVNIGQTNDVGSITSIPTTTALVFTQAKVVLQSDLLEATMSFADPSKNWLTGIPDKDGTNGYNWIRSGSNKAATAGDANNNDMFFGENAIDPNQVFEGVLGGTWAPYCLVAAHKFPATAPNMATQAAPGYPLMNSAGILAGTYDIRLLSSIDIVFTSDKSKWTRSMVIEQCDEPAANPNGAKKFDLRRAKSVDKQGIAIGKPGCNLSEALIDTFNYGCSWFPGYAVNLETGERLNIAFGEDSYQAANNGADMMWNPTSVAEINSGSPNYAAFGGRHYIYVFGHNRSETKYNGTGSLNLDGKYVGAGTYANFVDFVHEYKKAAPATGSQNNILMANIWSEALWVNIPLLTSSRFAFTNPGDMPCDAKVRLRVKKSYKKGLAGSYYSNLPGYLSASTQCPVMPSKVQYDSYTVDTLVSNTNGNFGLYRFNTSDIFTEINNADKSKSALDLINVVPNPYYAYSTYEKNRLENVVRITNLPNKCKIKIFTMNGTLVRTYDRDVTGQEDINISSSEYVHSKRLPFQDWDVKNQSGIPVASGLYIIHIDVPGVGEKILKWFGVMRPLDLQSY